MATSMMSFLTSFLLFCIMISTVRFHGRWTADADNGVQKIHQGQVPRIGGLGVMAALFLSCLWLDEGAELGLMLAVILPAFIFGFVEDISKNVTPLWRLLACCLTGLAAWVSGISIGIVEIWFIDDLLRHPVMSLVVTIIVVAALANAMNMVDGLNGLASGYAILASGVFAGLAYFHGDMTLFAINLCFGAVLAGFFVFNWPFGKIFLGDGGAYLIGSFLALSAMKLAQSDNGITQAFTLVILAYPAWEIMMVMMRRFVKKSPLMLPDDQHLHTQLYRFAHHALPLSWRDHANALAAILILFICAVVMAVCLAVMLSFDLPAGSKFFIALAEFFLYSLVLRYISKRMLSAQN
ncbi:MAG: MraY family glycosyltransferase [Candidatus Puniceispirillaceae bacterium]